MQEECDYVIIQLNAIGRDTRLLDMANFKQAITHDHDLQSTVAEDRSKILAMLYILTGCDFTSFFVGLEKSAFLKVFFISQNS